MREYQVRQPHGQDDANGATGNLRWTSSLADGEKARSEPGCGLCWWWICLSRRRGNRASGRGGVPPVSIPLCGAVA